jgi:ABC-type phosphonate transport system ATPase subunit
LPVIRTENLRYVYSEGTPFEKAAVDGVDLNIEKGELLGVMGHTGSGKSTLIQHFNGILKPTSGRVLIDGEDIWRKGADMRALRFKVGLVFQYPEYQLFEETVFRDIAFGPKNMGLGEAEVSRARARGGGIRGPAGGAAGAVAVRALRRPDAPRGHSGRDGDAPGGAHTRRARRGAGPARARLHTAPDQRVPQGDGFDGAAGVAQHGGHSEIRVDQSACDE